MTLTNVWVFNHDLDSTTSDTVKGQLTIGSHKRVLATAYLTSKGDHQVASGSAAAVGFTQVAQGGSIKNFPVQQGVVDGANITELHWDLSVIACHARAAVVIQAFD